MFRQGIHHHSKREDMASHHEYKEDNLCSSKEFTTEASHHHLARVGHAVYMRIPQFELPEGIARVGG